MGFETSKENTTAYASWASSSRSGTWTKIIETDFADIEVRRDPSSATCIRVTNKRGSSVYDFYSEKSPGNVESIGGGSVTSGGTRAFNVDTNLESTYRRIMGSFMSIAGSAQSEKAVFYEVFYRISRTGTSPDYNYYTMVSAAVWSK